MARIKRGTTSHAKHKKVLKAAKGYYGSKHTLFKTANQAIMKSMAYSFIGRKRKKRDFRKSWIARINAATRQNGLSYSKFMYGLKQANIDMNRKMLSDLAIKDPAAFAKLVDIAKNA
ncbi:50S ribosomal protein L20 [Lagierella sp.]|uniref:50S ribosomal protein L20 n=1 Tax=Lagierella sp. TaxID=2849657 RepID=UPI002625FF1A|nr:50S ribosomal protein L20 [Lagierella sp.]